MFVFQIGLYLQDSVSHQWLQAVEDYISNCEKNTHDEESITITTSWDMKEKKALLEEIHAKLPRLQGDGSEAPDTLVQEGMFHESVALKDHRSFLSI